MILPQISMSIIWSVLFHSSHLTLSSQYPVFESPFLRGLKIFCLILKTHFQNSVKSQKPISSNYSLADQHSVIIFFRAWDANLDLSGWEILSNLWTVKRINHKHLVHQGVLKRCAQWSRSKLGASPSLLSEWPWDTVLMSTFSMSIATNDEIIHHNNIEVREKWKAKIIFPSKNMKATKTRVFYFKHTKPRIVNTR